MPPIQINPEDQSLDTDMADLTAEGRGPVIVRPQPDSERGQVSHEGRKASVRARAREKLRARRRVAVTLLRSLTAVLIGSLILRVAAQMMGLMLQSYFTKIGVPLAVMGFITASFFLAELLGAPVFGALSDLYGRKKIILLGPVLGAIAVEITSVTSVIWLLVITRLLEGLSTASAIPATLGYISEATSGHPRLRARVIGLFEITFVGGMALGAGLGGYVWKFFGDEATVAGLHFTSPAFSLNGIIYLISLAVFAWGLKNISAKHLSSSEASEYKKWNHYRGILRSPRVWRLVPAWLAINSVIGMWFNFSIRMLTETNRTPAVGDDIGGTLANPVLPGRFDNQLLLGLWSNSSEIVYLGFGIFLMIFAAGVLAWSFFISKYRKTTMMLIATAGLVAILPSVYCLNHFNLFLDSPHYSLISWLFVGLLLIGVIVLSGFAPAALTYLADVTESYAEDRGTIMGLYSVFLGIGQFIGTATGGVFAGRGGIDGLLLLSAIFGLVTALSLISLHRRNALISAQ